MARSTKSYEERMLQLEKKEQESWSNMVHAGLRIKNRKLMKYREPKRIVRM